MNRKGTMLLTMAASVLITLSACGGGGGSNPTSPRIEPDPLPTTWGASISSYNPQPGANLMMGNPIRIGIAYTALEDCVLTAAPFDAQGNNLETVVEGNIRGSSTGYVAIAADKHGTTMELVPQRHNVVVSYIRIVIGRGRPDPYTLEFPQGEFWRGEFPASYTVR